MARLAEWRRWPGWTLGAPAAARGSDASAPRGVVLRWRVAAAVVIGLASAALCYSFSTRSGLGLADFTFTWRAANSLRAGENPYHDPRLGPPNPYPWEVPLLYPLLGPLASLPFTCLPEAVAGAAFFGVSAALLAFALTRDGWWRLVLFTSAPFVVAAYIVQWSPLIMAAALLPALQPLALVKPNLGLPLLAARPSRRGLALCLGAVALSMLVLPSWPQDWLANLPYAAKYLPPVLVLPGPLLLLAAWRWRDERARLLLLLAISPQFLWFYDQLPLWLAPRTWRQGLLLSGLSWVALVGRVAIQDTALSLMAVSWLGLLTPWALAEATLRAYTVNVSSVWIVALIYLPALAMVLFPSGEGEVVAKRPRASAKTSRAAIGT